ncbi:MAG TPA: acetyl/propionyl-CoA carboxylase subunit alpha, partial [Microbacterium sp.]|nr:acetyl/propionyl-CoA carboxylase subunit alpha [Microbacterium sp.]
DALDAVAPMPGSVVAVHVTDDEQVAAGAVLVTIEAMKMEHPVLAPRAGRARLRVAMGDHVRRGDVVVDVAGPTDA